MADPYRTDPFERIRTFYQSLSVEEQNIFRIFRFHLSSLGALEKKLQQHGFSLSDPSVTKKIKEIDLETWAEGITQRDNLLEDIRERIKKNIYDLDALLPVMKEEIVLKNAFRFKIKIAKNPYLLVSYDDNTNPSLKYMHTLFVQCREKGILKKRKELRAMGCTHYLPKRKYYSFDYVFDALKVEYKRAINSENADCKNWLDSLFDIYTNINEKVAQALETR